MRGAIDMFTHLTFVTLFTHLSRTCSSRFQTCSQSIHCFVLFPGVPPAPRGPFLESSQKAPGKRRWEVVGEGWRRSEKVRESSRKFEKTKNKKEKHKTKTKNKNTKKILENNNMYIFLCFSSILLLPSSSVLLPCSLSRKKDGGGGKKKEAAGIIASAA